MYLDSTQLQSQNVKTSPLCIAFSLHGQGIMYSTVLLQKSSIKLPQEVVSFSVLSFPLQFSCYLTCEICWRRGREQMNLSLWSLIHDVKWVKGIYNNILVKFETEEERIFRSTNSLDRAGRWIRLADCMKSQLIAVIWLKRKQALVISAGEIVNISILCQDSLRVNFHLPYKWADNLFLGVTWQI